MGARGEEGLRGGGKGREKWWDIDRLEYAGPPGRVQWSIEGRHEHVTHHVEYMSEISEENIIVCPAQHRKHDVVFSRKTFSKAGTHPNRVIALFGILSLVFVSRWMCFTGSRSQSRCFGFGPFPTEAVVDCIFTRVMAHRFLCMEPSDSMSSSM